ncbi:hypothetical protein Tco_0566741 [Tanacetum coccineum]
MSTRTNGQRTRSFVVQDWQINNTYKHLDTDVDTKKYQLFDVINQRLLSLEETGRRGRSVRKRSLLGEGYTSRQLEEWKSRARGHEGHKHDRLRRKPQKAIQNGKNQTDGGNCLFGVTLEQLDRRPNHIGWDDQRLSCPKDLRGWKSNAPLIGLSGKIYHPLGLVDLRVTIEEQGRNKTVLLEFAIVKCRLPYNVIMRRTGMRSLRAVGSTIHLMIKFPMARGIATMKTIKETLWECKQIKEIQSLWKEAQWRQHMEQMSRIREQAILRTRRIIDQIPRKEPMVFEETWEEDTVKEKVIVSNDRPDQSIVINGKLSIGSKSIRFIRTGGS